MQNHYRLTVLFTIISGLMLLNQPLLLAQNKARQIDSLLSRYSTYGPLNGSVLVAEHGKVIYKKGFGLANREWDIPNEPDTRYRIASLTKQFTAVLVLQLVEKGKLRLNGKITDYLPEYPAKTGGKVALHHLLTHTSGIPDYFNRVDIAEKLEHRSYSPAAIIQTFSNFDLEFEPGQKYSYSNSGYVLLGAILEKVTGRPYETLLRENIFIPLGLKNTGHNSASTLVPKRASGYDAGLGTFENTEPEPFSLSFATGSLYSTVEDLFLWNQGWEKLLSKNSLTLMAQPYTPQPDTTWITPYAHRYGYGVAVAKVAPFPARDSLTMVFHSGHLPGFSSFMMRFNADNHLIVFLSNVAEVSTPRMNEMGLNIVRILYGQPTVLPKKSAAVALSTWLAKDSLSTNKDFYQQVTTSQSANYYFDERELTTVGNCLLAKKRLKEAIELLKLNIRHHPRSASAYTSLGAAYIKSGEKSAAIQQLAKALEINTGDRYALELLKKASN